MLGRWIAQTEGAKFWLTVVTELKNRGVQDVFIACVDGLKGFLEAIEAVYPKAIVQLCIVHLVRNSLNYVGWNKRKEVAADLRSIYTAATVEKAEQHLSAFEEKWSDASHPLLNRGVTTGSALSPSLHFRPKYAKSFTPPTPLSP